MGRIVYRASYPHPGTGNDYFEIQSAARALDNNMYIVAPNVGTYYLFPEDTTPIDTFGGRSYIFNYKGQKSASSNTAADQAMSPE